jgi:hypothetical protein
LEEAFPSVQKFETTAKKMLGWERSVSPLRNNSSNALPKTTDDLLLGTVLSEYKRCGKPNCKCQRGELHGPYYYRFYRVDGRLRREYVSKVRLPSVRQQIRAYRTFQGEIRAGNALRKRAMKLLKEYEHLWKP